MVNFLGATLNGPGEVDHRQDLTPLEEGGEVDVRAGADVADYLGRGD